MYGNLVKSHPCAICPDCVLCHAESLQLVSGGALQSAGVQHRSPQGSAGLPPHVCKPDGAVPGQGGAAAPGHAGEVLPGWPSYSALQHLYDGPILEQVPDIV